MQGNVPATGHRFRLSQKLPLLQSKKRQLVNPDKQKFRALVLIDIVLALANIQTA